MRRSIPLLVSASLCLAPLAQAQQQSHFKRHKKAYITALAVLLAAGGGVGLYFLLKDKKKDGSSDAEKPEDTTSPDKSSADAEALIADAKRRAENVATAKRLVKAIKLAGVKVDPEQAQLAKRFRDMTELERDNALVRMSEKHRVELAEAEKGRHVRLVELVKGMTEEERAAVGAECLRGKTKEEKIEEARLKEREARLKERDAAKAAAKDRAVLQRRYRDVKLHPLLKRKGLLLKREGLRIVGPVTVVDGEGREVVVRAGHVSDQRKGKVGRSWELGFSGKQTSVGELRKKEAQRQELAPQRRMERRAERAQRQREERERKYEEQELEVRGREIRWRQSATTLGQSAASRFPEVRVVKHAAAFEDRFPGVALNGQGQEEITLEEEQGDWSDGDAEEASDADAGGFPQLTTDGAGTLPPLNSEWDE